MKTLLVTGTDTDVGKTFVSSLVLRGLCEDGRRVGAYKPVCSGAVAMSDGGLCWEDVEQLRDHCSRQHNRELICPQAFRAAVAPNVAATMEGRSVDDRLLLEGLNRWRSIVDFVVVEGAGGLLCPLSDKSTMADFAQGVSGPLVLVAANRLGVINHTLLSMDVAKLRNLNVRAVVLNDTSPDQSEESQASNLAQLHHWIPDVCLLSCPYNSNSLIDGNGNPLPVRSLFD